MAIERKTNSSGDPAHWTATEMARAIRRKEISCVEIMESTLKNVARQNPRLNAIVELLAQEALTEAANADQAVAKGDAFGPLHGIPVSTKINTDQSGCATSDGVVTFAERIAKEDSSSIRNLRQAGAIIFGRTNSPCLSSRWFTDNDLYGRTVNPRSPDITCGGSSGGAAVAVSVGFGPIAQGTDNAGSIRYPAYACGVAGLRSTPGRVPKYNPTDGAPTAMPLLANVHGPLARRIEDLWLVLPAIAVRDERDPSWIPAPLGARGAPPKRPIAIYAGPARTTPEVRSAVHQAGHWLIDAGYDVEEVSPPDLATPAMLRGALAWAEGRSTRLAFADKYADTTCKAALHNMAALAPDFNFQQYVEGFSKRQMLLREWLAFFERFSALVLPTSYEPPFPMSLDETKIEVMANMLAALEPILAFPFLGLPALAVPTSVTAERPLGVQVVSAPFREDICLNIGEVLETARREMSPTTDD